MRRWDRIRLAVGMALSAVVVGSALGLWATGSGPPAGAGGPPAGTPTPLPFATGVAGITISGPATVRPSTPSPMVCCTPAADPAVDAACTDALRGWAEMGIRVVLPDDELPPECDGVDHRTAAWEVDSQSVELCMEAIAHRPRDAVMDDPDMACAGVPDGDYRMLGERVGRPFPRGAG